MVEAKSLSKVFTDDKKKEIVAVNNVDFYAKSGEIHGILGVNGAGKTTLLRILSTVIRPTSGTATVAGHDILTEATKVRANIGFLSASTALYGRLTGIEMLTYFGKLYGFTGSELKDRVNYALNQTESEEFCRQLCDRMSTGQKQRISIARTILHDPTVLFLDEPTAGLDILSSQTIMGFIERARDQGKAVIFSTHIMSEIERLCEAATIIHDGVVKGRGTLEMLKADSGEENIERMFLHYVKPKEVSQ